MSRHAFILFAQPTAGALSIAVIRGGQIQPAESSLEALGQTLGSLGYRGEPVLLALSSTWCLAATIDSRGLPARDRKAMLFRLEELIPLAAEEVTGDVVPGEKTSLGVCVQTPRLRELVSAIESAGAWVEAIAPAALLAAQGARLRGGDSILLLGHDGAVDVIKLDDGVPVSWGWTAACPDDVQIQIRAVAGDSGAAARVIAAGVDSNLCPDATSLDRPPIELATIAGAAILRGIERPWINLRRDALAPTDPIGRHRTALNFMLAAAACLLLALALVNWMKTSRLNSAAADSQTAMADAFHARFPDWPVPANVRAVVESERQKFADADSPHAGDRSALASMRDVIASLPANESITIDSMAFQGDAFEMVGTIGNAAALASLVGGERSAGFDVQPPQSRGVDEKGLNFSISGETRRKP